MVFTQKSAKSREKEWTIFLLLQIPVSWICMSLAITQWGKKQKWRLFTIRNSCQKEILTAMIYQEFNTFSISQEWLKFCTSIMSSLSHVLTMFQILMSVLRTVATGFILSSLKKDSESGFFQGMLMLMFPSLGRLPGSRCLSRNMDCLWWSHGESGGWRDCMPMRIKWVEWYGNWKILHLFQSRAQDIWCQRINLKKQKFWLTALFKAWPLPKNRIDVDTLNIWGFIFDHK